MQNLSWHVADSHSEHHKVVAADAIADRDNARTVVEALAELPDEQRHVIALAYVEGPTQEPMATRLGIPLGTFKGRARLALDRLRPSLDADDILGWR